MAFQTIPLVCDAWALVTGHFATDTLICSTGSARFVCGDMASEPINVGIPLAAGEKLVIPAGVQVWACGAGAEAFMLTTPFSS